MVLVVYKGSIDISIFVDLGDVPRVIIGIAVGPAVGLRLAQDTLVGHAGNPVGGAAAAVRFIDLACAVSVGGGGNGNLLSGRPSGRIIAVSYHRAVGQRCACELLAVIVGKPGHGGGVPNRMPLGDQLTHGIVGVAVGNAVVPLNLGQALLGIVLIGPDLAGGIILPHGGISAGVKGIPVGENVIVLRAHNPVLPVIQNLGLIPIPIGVGFDPAVGSLIGVAHQRAVPHLNARRVAVRI